MLQNMATVFHMNEERIYSTVIHLYGQTIMAEIDSL